MIAILRRYPKIVYRLLFIVFVLFIISYLVKSVFIDFGMRDPSYRIWAYWAGFIGVIVAGFLADQVREVQKGMMVSLMVMVFGTLAMYLVPIDSSVVVGEFLATTAFHVFYFLILIHLAVLFPVATDWKDNVFLMIGVTVAIAGEVVGFILLFNGTFDGNFDRVAYAKNRWAIALVILMMTILLAWYIYRSDQIGFNILDEEEEEEQASSKWPILAGLVLLFTTINVASSALPLIAAEGGQMLDYLLWDVNSWMQNVLSILMTLAGIATIGFILHFSRSYSRQYEKIVWTMGIFFGVAAVLAAARLVGNVGLGPSAAKILGFLNAFIVLPILFSVATHVNLGKRTGLWLGILLGAPQVLAQLMFLIPTDAFYGLLQPVIALTMLTLCFIFLRENKDRILEMLALEESNQEREESSPNSPDDEIMNHLIEP